MLALLSLAPPALQASTQELAPAERVDTLFSRWATGSTPGCAVAVAWNGSVDHAAGYGMADLEQGTRIEPGSVFGLASISKQFTGTAAAILVERGELDLDADIREYLPELPAYERQIRVRDLVHMTSGLRDWIGLVGLAGRDQEGVVDEGQRLRLLAAQRGLTHAPGRAYLYSNSNYLLLAEIIQRVTGRPFPEVMDEMLFEPLGMRTARFPSLNQVIPGRAEGYAFREGERRQIDFAPLSGEGGAFGSVLDLVAWDARFEDDRLGIDPRRLRERIRQTASIDGQDVGYGFGTQYSTYRGVDLESHGGTWGGYRAYYLRVPAHDLATAVLCNDRSISPHQLTRRIVDIYLGPELTAREGDVPSPYTPGYDASGHRSDDESSAIGVDAAPDAPGSYVSDELDVTYRLYPEEGGLYLRMGWSEPYAIVEARGDTLQFAGGQLTMRRNTNGRVHALVLSAPRIGEILLQRTGVAPSIVIPTGTSGVVDGRETPGEWDEAVEVPIRVDSEWTVRVRLKHDGEALWAAFSNLRDGVPRMPELMVDAHHDGRGVWDEDDRWFHASFQDCMARGRHDDYSACTPEHDEFEATNAAGDTEFPEVMEIRIPLRVLGLDPSSGRQFGIALNVTDTSTNWSFWPAEAQLGAPGSWGEARLETVAP